MLARRPAAPGNHQFGTGRAAEPIATGLSIGFGSAVVVCLVAEIKFSPAGLGTMVIDSYNRSRFAEVYAVLVVIVGITIAANKAITFFGPCLKRLVI